jgi:hypothetical protein
MRKAKSCPAHASCPGGNGGSSRATDCRSEVSTSPVVLTLLLGDVARVAEGKLDILGAGWSVTRTPANLGVGMLVEIPWAEIGPAHRIEVVLQDEEGQVLTKEDGEPVLKIDAELGAHRPPGVVLGLPVTIPIAITCTGVPLAPGHRFRLQAAVDGHDCPDSCVVFSTVPEAPGQIAV